MLMEIIRHIPWYVFLILYILLKRGIKALKDQQIPLSKLFIFPVIMTIWAFYDIQKLFGLMHISIILSAFFGLSLGIGVGILIVRNKAMYINQMFILKGSFSTLILVITIFILKFITFSFIAYNESIVNNTIFAITCSFIFFLIAGITLGRLFYYLYIFKLKLTVVN